MDDAQRNRPVTVRLLAVLLALQAATAVCLVGLGVVAAGVAYFAGRGRSDWSDLVVALCLMAAVIGAVLAVAPVFAWVALRRRRAGGLLIAASLQVLPPATLAVLLWMVGLGSRVAWPAVGWAGAGLATLGLALAPPTRAWLTSPAPERSAPSAPPRPASGTIDRAPPGNQDQQAPRAGRPDVAAAVDDEVDQDAG